VSQLNLSDPPGQRVSKPFGRKQGPRGLLAQFFESPICLKWLMAVTGLVGLGFVLVHMIGNLHLYEGPAEVNAYGEALRELGGELVPRGTVLWLLRFGLIAAVAVHIYAAYRLTVINHKARPVKYQSKRDYIAADYAGRTMRLSGIWLSAFILYHLADLTWGRGIASDSFIRGDIYNNAVESLSNPLVAAFYLVSMLALGLHLFHGAWSLFQSLGAASPTYNSWRRAVATGFAAIVVAGNLSFPIMVQTGLITQDGRCWPSEAEVHHALEAGGSMAQIEALVADIEADGGCPWQDGRFAGSIGYPPARTEAAPAQPEAVEASP
jgi:succinate dehydrogenase / fumarate reductase, cytochrome b subunit